MFEGKSPFLTFFGEQFHRIVQFPAGKTRNKLLGPGLKHYLVERTLLFHDAVVWFLPQPHQHWRALERIKGLTYDISAVGARIETTLPLRRGDQLELEIGLFHSGGVRTLARVVWCAPVRASDRPLNWVGLEFLELHIEEQIKILQFLLDSQTAERGKTR